MFVLFNNGGWFKYNNIQHDISVKCILFPYSCCIYLFLGFFLNFLFHFFVFKFFISICDCFKQHESIHTFQLNGNFIFACDIWSCWKEPTDAFSFHPVYLYNLIQLTAFKMKHRKTNKWKGRIENGERNGFEISFKQLETIVNHLWHIWLDSMQCQWIFKLNFECLVSNMWYYSISAVALGGDPLTMHW